MSYDISLYVKAFLDRAVATGLGDRTDSDPIPEQASKALIEKAMAAGFAPTVADPSFIAFLKEEGVEPAIEFELDSAECLAHLSIHQGELAFTVPYSDRASASIQLCSQIAKAIAAEHGLGFWDPQSDEAAQGEAE